MLSIAGYTILVALALPLIAYIWAVLNTPREEVSTPANYFVAYGRASAAPYADSSLAYAFQVATLYPFLYWGVQGQILPAIVNSLCWGIGILIFRRYAHRILGHLRDSSDAPKTLHGVLGDAFHSRAIRRIAAGVTILGMLGLALAEAYWGTQVLTLLLPADTPRFYALVFGILFLVLTYIWYGGAWGSMRTDMLQLVFSYIGFAVVFMFVVIQYFLSSASANSSIPVIALFMVLGGTFSLWSRWRAKIKPIAGMLPNHNSSLGKPEEHERVWRQLAKALSPATIAALCLIIICFAAVFVRSVPSLSISPMLQLGDPGWLGLLALIVLPIFFQFVDMSAWQRIQSLPNADNNIEKSVRRGLLVFAIESPFTWILCLALGVLLSATMPALLTAPDKAGPLAAFPRLLLSGGPVSVFIAAVFVIAVMAVMLSTIDSALTAAMYAYVADFQELDLQASNNNPSIATAVQTGRERQLQLLRSGKLWAFIFIITLCSLILLLGIHLQKADQLIGGLFGFYAAMLSLLPAVIMMLIGKPIRWNSTSIAGGILLGVATAFGFTLWGIIVPDKVWLSVFGAVCAAPALAAIPPIAARLAIWLWKKRSGSAV